MTSHRTMPPRAETFSAGVTRDIDPARRYASRVDGPGTCIASEPRDRISCSEIATEICYECMTGPTEPGGPALHRKLGSAGRQEGDETLANRTMSGVGRAA